MENDLSIISTNIKKLRERKGLSQRSLASELGLAFQTVSNWETRKSRPKSIHLKLLADFFGISVEQLTSEQSSQGKDSVGDQQIPVLTEQTVRLLIRQEVRSLLEEFIVQPPERKKEKVRMYDLRLVNQIEKPSDLKQKESSRFDLNFEALKRWVESDEVFEVSEEMLMEFCLNYNLQERQRRIEDVTEALKFMLEAKITGGVE